MKHTLFVIAILSLAGCGGDEPPPVEDTATPGLLAFTNATFWDGTGDAGADRSVLIVRDGRIESLGANPVPEDATVVDLGGGFVTPGLINTHGHVNGRWAGADVTGERERVIGSLKLLARYGVTTVNSLGGEPPATFGLRDEQETASLDRARV